MPGTDVLGRAKVQTVGFWQTPQTGRLLLQQTVAARTTSLSLSTPAQDLRRPVASHTLLRLSAAHLFQRADGTACIQSGGSTRCLGDAPGPLLHGGVQLHAITANQREATVQFTLLQDFPVGPLTLRPAPMPVTCRSIRPTVCPRRWLSSLCIVA
jgi:hypothetical protein